MPHWTKQGPPADERRFWAAQRWAGSRLRPCWRSLPTKSS